MSGTSLDGIDAVLAEIGPSGQRLWRSHYLPYPEGLRRRLTALQVSGRNELHRAASAANELSCCCAHAVENLLAESGFPRHQVKAVGCHGQTLRHCPDLAYTIQLINGALLAELTGITVVCDFRSRDIAAGGQGAPLVPAFHSTVFGHPQHHRVIVNVGGIANLTDLPPRGPVAGFDTGPGNLLLDAWMQRTTGERMDTDGAWAASGKVIPALMDALLAHDYFRKPPPKSTGRDTFNLSWVEGLLSRNEKAADVQATLLELTATTIAQAIREHCRGADEIYLCGGGARNRALVQALTAALGGARVDATDLLGIDADFLEAFAFAWLAHRAVHGEPGNLPQVTGAKGPRILGAIYQA